MQAQCLKKGFYVVGRTTTTARYRPCTLLAGPYFFQNAVRLRIGKHELICCADQFVETKPITKRARDRNDLADLVLGIIEKHGGEIGLVELAKQAKIWPAVALWQRLAHWDEFQAVNWRANGTFRYP